MASNHPASTNITAQNQLVKWINEAGMAEGTKKANLLRKILEVLLHQIPQMIPTYLDNILSYTNDKTTDVKKQVIVFIEHLSKLHPEHSLKAISQLQLLLSDSVIAIQKRAIQASSIVYVKMLQWICTSNAKMDDKAYVWEQISQLKLIILNMIDSDNEGIRTHSIKFLEEVVLLQTVNEGPGSGEDEFSLDKIPDNLPFIKRSALEMESEHIFTLLIKFHNSQHISSVNLMACMTTLCVLAKARPKYMPRVIQALGDLHTTLPPTLSQFQVNSVRKHLKMLLIKILKQQPSTEMFPQITQLLLDTGMTPQEINKSLPKERRNKRLGEVRSGDAPSKRPRIDSPQSNSQSSDSNSRSDAFLPSEETVVPIVTEDSLCEGLNNVDNVVSLVLSTLKNHLPNEMPSDFVALYKPVSNAGTKTQKRTLAQMINSLIKGEPVVVTPPPVTPIFQPPISDVTAKIPLLRDEDEKLTLKNAVAKLQETNKADKHVEEAVNRLMEETRQEHLKEEEKKTKEKEKLIPPPTPTVPKLKQRVKLLKLQEITRPIPKEIKEKLVLQAVTRILKADKDAQIGGAANIRAKFITLFASSYTLELRELVLSYILEEPISRIDLAISWLYEEYAFMQGFSRHPVTLQPKILEKHDQNYNQLLCALITQIVEQGDPNTDNSKDVLLRKIYLEAPLVTQEAVDYLKHLVSEEKMAFLALDLLEEICMLRPPRAHKYVTALLAHVLNENDDIRDTCLKSTVKVYKTGSDAVKKVVEKYATLYLGFISLHSPPLDLFMEEHARVKHKWSDGLYKLCLNLIMALFPENEDLIIEVARVYGQANAEAKRCVLRCIETPIRQLSDGEPRPAFLKLLEECPRGSETLLTRLVHILTEKAPPTPELVSLVRDLYATRVSDVRFLIPVLNGLTKKEILAALPKLIKLNPVVVKEVFNKLLGLQNPNEEHLPITPAELLVALHLIDPNKADLKYIIKATAICFAEKQTFTQEVLSGVLTRLLDCEEIPVLMMRSVLQALTLYPALTPRVLAILQKLIDKEVWSNKVAWEGWLKCCERTLPLSCTVIVRLPAGPLAACASGPCGPALREHVASLPPAQRATLPQYVLTELAPTQREPLPPGME